MNVSPVYGEEKDLSGRVVKRTVTGYRALNSLEICVREIGKVGPIAQQLIDKGGNVFSGISFSVSDERCGATSCARAIQQALRRAKILPMRSGQGRADDPASAAERPVDGCAGIAPRRRGAPAAIPDEPGANSDRAGDGDVADRRITA